MLKLIIPFEGAGYSEGAFAFTRLLQEQTTLLVTGVFLPEVDFARFFFFPAAFTAPAYTMGKEKADEEALDRNVAYFSDWCEKMKLPYRVHKNLYESAIPFLSRETRFADLMLIGSEVFYTAGADGPMEYLREAMRHTECPVVIVPEKFEPPRQVILAYDGSAACLFAIRQFVALFPALCALPACLVYVGDPHQEVPQKDLALEFLGCHFAKLSLTQLDSAEKHAFPAWLGSRESPLLVSGSFGRSGVSELFTRGFIVDSIRQHRTPIFVAHQ